MFLYKIFGLYLKCYFKISFLNSLDEKLVPENTDFINVIDDSSSIPNSINLSCENFIVSSIKETYFVKKGLAVFKITDGNTISIKTLSQECSLERLSRPLINTAMGYLLYQRGEFALHASAASVNNKAILFLGNSGSGKSSVAASIQDISKFITEDIALIKFSDQKTPMAIHSYPLVKLDNNFVDNHKFNFKKQYKLADDYLNRHYYELETTANKKDIKNCYLLSWDDEVKISKPSIKTLLGFFITSSFTCYPQNSCKESNEILFKQIDLLMKSVNFYHFSRPKKFSKDTIDILSNHIRDS